MRARWKRSSPPLRCGVMNQSAIPSPSPAAATRAPSNTVLLASERPARRGRSLSLVTLCYSARRAATRSGTAATVSRISASAKRCRGRRRRPPSRRRPRNRLHASAAETPRTRSDARDQRARQEHARGRRRAAAPRGPSQCPAGAGRPRAPAARELPRDAPASERARGVAVHPAALAAVDERRAAAAPASRSRRARSASRGPAVLREPAQVAADVLDEHPPAVRGAADVHGLGVGREPDRPARLRGSGRASRSPR